MKVISVQRNGEKMMKKLSSFLMAIALVITTIPMFGAHGLTVKAFQDVDRESWYAGYVYALSNKGIVSGMDANHFGPQTSLTRAQLVTMLAYKETKDSIENYRNGKKFSDVKSTDWFAPFVNWAAEKGISAGYNDGTFGPNRSVTRAEAATLIIKYAESEQIELSETNNRNTVFSDDSKIPNWAKENVYRSLHAGLVGGYPDGSFGASKTMTRAEASVVLCRLFDVEPLNKEDIPENKQPSGSTEIKSIQKSVAGYSVNGVEFDPTGFRAGVILANDKFYSTESVSSMVSRSGAAIASNGAFFNNQGDLTTYSAFIRDGKALRIDNANYPYKCYFVQDSNGNASMQYMKVLQTAKLIQNGQTVDGAVLEEVGCNYNFASTDGSRIVFTKEFGNTVPGTVKVAVICDENGTVTKVIDSDTPQTVSIPENGFVLCERKRRDEGDQYKWEFFFEKIKVGDTVQLSLSYEGSSVQNVQMAFCCGPVVVKNGSAYGNNSTYAQEGYTDSKVISGSGQRTCIGVKSDGTVVLITAGASLSGLSQIMAALGCQNAMNLDGGASSALYVNGSARVSAGRALTHMIVFQRR